MPAPLPHRERETGSVPWTWRLVRQAAVTGGVTVVLGAQSLIVGAAFLYALATGLASRDGDLMGDGPESSDWRSHNS